MYNTSIEKLRKSADIAVAAFLDSMKGEVKHLRSKTQLPIATVNLAA